MGDSLSKRSAIVAALSVGVGFFVGRMSALLFAPAAHEECVEVVERVRTVVVREHVHHERAQKATEKVVFRTVQQPCQEGLVVLEERVVERAVEQQERLSLDLEFADRGREVVQVETKTDVQPDWFLSVMGGYTLPRHEWAVGLSVDRRIAGPFTLGVWGLYHSDRQVSLGAKIGVWW